MDIPIELCQCGCGQATRISAKTDISKDWVSGVPLRFLRGHSFSRLQTVENILARILVVATGGYGSVSIRGQEIRVHRWSYEYFKGPIPTGKIVMHDCDNRICCNPSHLVTGTNADNSADMVKKGREAKGESQGLSKLKIADIMEIRASQDTQGRLAELFGVDPSTVSQIRRGKTWKHVGGGHVV